MVDVGFPFEWDIGCSIDKVKIIANYQSSTPTMIISTNCMVRRHDFLFFWQTKYKELNSYKKNFLTIIANSSIN